MTPKRCTFTPTISDRSICPFRPLTAGRVVCQWMRWQFFLWVTWFWLPQLSGPVLAQVPSAPSAAAVARFEAAQDAHQAGKLTEALRLYDEALAIDATLAPVHFQRGMALLALHRAAEAVKAFERCVQLQPDFLRGWLQMGIAALAANDPAQAEKAYATALRLAPNHVEARLRLARLALENHKPEVALSTLAPLSENAPPDVTVLRGQAHLLAGQPEEAVQAFSQVLSVQSDVPEARRGRGDAYAAQGRLEAAVTDWQAAYASMPDAALAADIVSALHQLDRQEAACAFLETARKQFPQHEPLATLASSLKSETAIESAAALLRAGRFAEAVAAYTPLVAQAPEATAPRAGLATALFKLNRFAEAAQHFAILCRQQPEVAATYFFLGVCYDKMGDYRRALAAYEAFLACADGVQNHLEIEKVHLRLPSLRRQAEQSKPRKP
ncbi:MAG: tetratricopeptide repeat protein [Acidobacteriota bacterium]